MRPINLKLKGINSYVTEQEIKFDKLAESKLFGIFGETGSGKTTILDGIVLALYGTSERETIGNMINVNVKSAHVYFDFAETENGEDVIYRVRREYKLRDSGVKQDAILTIPVTGKVLADTTESVNDKVLEIIGVGKKEFLKCVALPQGEFDRFLIDTPAGRKKTIAKLFNLEHFGAVLQERIKTRKDITALKLENIKDKLALYVGVTQEALYTSHITLATKQKRLKEIKKELATAEKKYNQLSADFDLNTRLCDNMAQLTIKNAERSDVLALKEQIEFTEKFGNLVLFLTREQTYKNDLKELEPTLKADKAKLEKTNEELYASVDTLGVLQSSKAELEKQFAAEQDRMNEYNLKKHALDELRENIDRLVLESKELETQVDELKEKLSQLQWGQVEQNKSLNSLNELLNNNNVLLEKIKSSIAVKTIDDFVEYLNHLRSLIDPDALQEVYQYDVYEQVNAVLLSMQNYELSKRKSVAGIKKDYDALLAISKDFNKLQSDIEAKNQELNIAMAKIKEGLDKTNQLIVATKTQISERDALKESKLTEAKAIGVKAIGLEAELKQYSNLGQLVKLEAELNELNINLDSTTERIKTLTDEKNSLVVSVEVASAHIESLNTSLKDITETIRTLKIKANTDNVNEKYCLNADELADAKRHVEEYDSQVGRLEASIKEIKSKMVNKNVTKVEVEIYEKSITTLKEEEGRISVEIGVLTEKVDKLKEDLKVVKQLTKEQTDMQDAYDTVIKLQALITGGGLLEYVSEEYMGLITEFANKYVYQISKGKYLLRYKGEFFVLDNFNGGIPRSVKTLSGGERFIISLSLALGISQSISVNNNKSFNFFFIDEGFGSLSDDYIENVLNSFNELIKLDFTVGFITHVDRMQEFINNRIVVTKPNNEVGTQIKQYY